MQSSLPAASQPTSVLSRSPAVPRRNDSTLIERQSRTAPRELVQANAGLSGTAQLWRQSTGKEKNIHSRRTLQLVCVCEGKKEILGSTAFANSSSHGLFPQKIRCVSRRPELPYQLFTTPPLREDVLLAATDLLLKDPDGEAIRCLHRSTAPQSLLCITREGCGTWVLLTASLLCEHSEENRAAHTSPAPPCLSQKTSAVSVH